MQVEKPIHESFSEADMRAFEPMMKIGILATVTGDGLPHLSLISTLGASDPTTVIWGQFTEGMSKSQIRENPKTGFLIMTLDKQLWRGKATWTHVATTGPEYEMYNNTPMFRYNSYFGIHTVYYMDLLEQYGQESLPMGKVVLAAIQTMIARTLAGSKGSRPVMNAWTQALLNKVSNLKFLSYVGADGYPVIIPVIQAQARHSEQVLFALSAYGAELREIAPGTPVAVFGMSLDMEDVLLRGVFGGVSRVGGVLCGRVEVNWVYSPMPPVAGQVYPPVELAPVRAF